MDNFDYLASIFLALQEDAVVLSSVPSDWIILESATRLADAYVLYMSPGGRVLAYTNAESMLYIQLGP